MQQITSEQDIIALLLRGAPLLDLRAPLEFRRGALPGAVNIPLLDDEQRAAVGLSYRQGGRDAAIATGHSLITAPVKARRLADWHGYLASHPDAALYCLRGGLRSEIAQQWLADAGVAVPRIAGGYRRVRQLLQARLEGLVTDGDASLPAKFAPLPLTVIAGKTGCGKTHLLARLHRSIDLEGLANHRGSAFGQRPGGQPSQADFENRLSLAFLRYAEEGAGDSPPPHEARLFLEDESRSIGSLCLPRSLHQAMARAPMALIEAPLTQRSRRIMEDYILSDYNELQRAEQKDAAKKSAAQKSAEQKGTMQKTSLPDTPRQRFSDSLRGALARIERRLGGDNYRRIAKMLEQALHAQFEQGSSDAHLHWISELLKVYYDPMYDYQLSRKSNDIIFRGSAEEFLDWAADTDGDVMGPDIVTETGFAVFPPHRTASA